MHATRSRALALLVPLALLCGLTLAGTPALPARAQTPTTSPTAAPTPQGVQSLPVAAARGTVADAAGTGALVARLASTDVATFNQVGLSWAAGGSATLVPQVRVRAGGTWGEWMTLQLEESERGRIGTELAFTGSADAVEARVLSTDGTTASDVKATLIDSNALPAVSGAEPQLGGNATSLNAMRSDQVVTDVPQPTIVTRQQWGADPAYWNVGKDPECAAPVANFQGAVVHHTAGSNTYTAAEAPGVVRGIYYYHAVQLDWCDIGYNFLVDKFGTIYQGRVGDMQQAIWGAHATYVNGRSVGVSYLGETTAVAPTAAGVRAIADVIAWRFGRYDKLPSDTAMYYSGSNPDPQPAITGHGYLKYHSTSCPGTGLKNQMDNIRAMVASRLTRYTLTWDRIPDMLPGNRTVALTGRIAAGPGGNVSFDVVAPDGTLIADVATAPLGADGYYSTTWTMPAGWSGTATLTAHHTVPGAGTMYGEQSVSSKAGITINQPASASVDHSVALGGWVEPAAPGTVVTVFGADAGGYTERLGTATTDQQGNWTFTTGFGTGTTQSLSFWATGTVAGQAATSNKVTFQRQSWTAGLSINQQAAFLSDDMLLYGATTPGLGGTNVDVYGRAPGGAVTWLGNDTTDAAGNWALWTSFQNNTTTAFEVWATATVAGSAQTSPRLYASYAVRKLILDSPNAVPLGQPLTLTGRMYLPGGELGLEVWGREPGGPTVLVGQTVTDKNGEFRITTMFGATSLAQMEFWAASPAATASEHVQSARIGQDTASLAGSLFRATSPTRIVDSRLGMGLAQALPSQSPVNIVLAGKGGIPANATAVVLNVTGTQSTARGHLDMWPAGRTRSAASSLNYAPGANIANQVTIPLGDNGAISVANVAPGEMHLILDVAGWYLPQTGRPAGSYVALPTPQRLADSRRSMGVTPLAAFGAQALQVTGQLGIPTSGVSAVAVNITTVAPRFPGYLAAYESGIARPNISTVNYVPGSDIPNASIVKLGADGRITLHNQSDAAVDVVVDVVGYYVAGSATASGAYVPVATSRLLDTRVGTGISGKLGPSSSTAWQVTGRGQVPSTADAVVLNATVTQPTYDGWFSLSPAGEAVSNASNVNFAAGADVANLTTTRLGTGGQLLANNGALGWIHALADVQGYFLR